MWTHGPWHLVLIQPRYLSPGVALLAAAAFPSSWGHRKVAGLAAVGFVAGVLVPNEHWSLGWSDAWCLARHQLRVLPWAFLLA